jgi:hypothetical protein
MKGDGKSVWKPYRLKPQTYDSRFVSSFCRCMAFEERTRCFTCVVGPFILPISGEEEFTGM